MMDGERVDIFFGNFKLKKTKVVDQKLFLKYVLLSSSSVKLGNYFILFTYLIRKWCEQCYSRYFKKSLAHSKISDDRQN